MSQVSQTSLVNYEAAARLEADLRNRQQLGKTQPEPKTIEAEVVEEASGITVSLSSPSPGAAPGPSMEARSEENGVRDNSKLRADSLKSPRAGHSIYSPAQSGISSISLRRVGENIDTFA